MGKETKHSVRRALSKQGLIQPVRGVGSLTCEACQWCRQWCARWTAPRVLGTSSSPLLKDCLPCALSWLCPDGLRSLSSHFLQLGRFVFAPTENPDGFLNLGFSSLRSDPRCPGPGCQHPGVWVCLQRKLEATVIKVIWIDFFLFLPPSFSPCSPPHPLNLILPSAAIELSLLQGWKGISNFPEEELRRPLSVRSWTWKSSKQPPSDFNTEALWCCFLCKVWSSSSLNNDNFEP